MHLTPWTEERWRGRPTGPGKVWAHGRIEPGKGETGGDLEQRIADVFLSKLGEMDAEQLWESTMDPTVRSLYRVELEDAVAAALSAELGSRGPATLNASAAIAFSAATNRPSPLTTNAAGTFCPRSPSD
mgnify:CR=1 FL=1